MAKKHLLPLSVCILILIFSCNSSEVKEIKNDSTAIATDTTEQTEFFDVKVCTEFLPPPEPQLNLKYETDTAIYPREGQPNDTMVQINLAQKIRQRQVIQYITSLTPYKWSHTTLTVTFLDGDPIVQDKVMKTAKQWEEHCGVRFNFGMFVNPDITISFRYKGSWSYVGDYSAEMRPSMNFGWLRPNSSDEEYNRVVLHEFGHALGFVHEHQSPKANIQWDSMKVYRYYQGAPNNWDTVTVNHNIFDKYSLTETNGTAFDVKSIMLYAIPGSLTKNGFSTESNSMLSSDDKWFVGQLYPKK